MQRLPNTPEGETKPIGFRLPPPMLAMIDREVGALRAASPEGASVTRSTALRALLVELEQRRAADPARAPTGDGREGEHIAAAAAEVRRILAEMDTAAPSCARSSRERLVVKFHGGKIKRDNATRERRVREFRALYKNECNGVHLSRTPPLVGSCPC